jgi:acyl-CoA thioester hydrolase
VIELAVRIYLEDTDAGGVVYHASYLRLMERARTEFLRSAGMEQSQTFGQDVSFVVARMRIDFLRPARLDDQVLVTCVVRSARGASFVLEQSVESSSREVVHARAEVVVACIQLSTERPTRLPGPLRAFVDAETGRPTEPGAPSSGDAGR